MAIVMVSGLTSGRVESMRGSGLVLEANVVLEEVGRKLPEVTDAVVARLRAAGRSSDVSTVLTYRHRCVWVAGAKTATGSWFVSRIPEGKPDEPRTDVRFLRSLPTAVWRIHDWPGRHTVSRCYAAQADENGQIEAGGLIVKLARFMRLRDMEDLHGVLRPTEEGNQTLEVVVGSAATASPAQRPGASSLR